MLQVRKRAMAGRAQPGIYRWRVRTPYIRPTGGSPGGIRADVVAAATQTAVVFWFTQMSSLTGFYILAVLFGLANSGVMTCLMVCVQDTIPVHRRGMAIGIITLFAWIGMGLGGFQGGVFFDRTGTYAVSYANAALSGVVNLLIFWAFVSHITRKHAAQAGLDVP